MELTPEKLDELSEAVAPKMRFGGCDLKTLVKNPGKETDCVTANEPIPTLTRIELQYALHKFAEILRESKKILQFEAEDWYYSHGTHAISFEEQVDRLSDILFGKSRLAVKEGM